VERLDIIASGGAGGLTNARAANLDNIDTEVADIQARLPAALVSGRMDSDVGAMQNNTITGSVISADAIGSSELAVDAISSSELSASAITEIQSGLATSAALDTVDNFVDDLESRMGTPSDLGSGATLAANLSDIESQTDDIGGAGVGLTEAGGTGDQLTAIPSGDIPKNATLANFTFTMVDSTDHISPKTGLTVTGQRSCDGASFTAVTGTIAEIANGAYQFDAAAADTNCNMFIWYFTASGADSRMFHFRAKQ
jgi:hypothetical protein